MSPVRCFAVSSRSFSFFLQMKVSCMIWVFFSILGLKSYLLSMIQLTIRSTAVLIPTVVCVYVCVRVYVCVQPEVGGLVVRMPLEVELYRNYRHSLMGRRLKEILTKERSVRNSDGSTVPLDIGIWYARAKKMVEQEMGKIANMADDQGQIDATKLKEEASEMLSLYLDNQETWQEVCLVVEKDDGDATTLVLNRPMAFQLTENLGRLVLFGAFQSERERNGAVGSSRQDLVRFMMAFRQECAVYVGGPDEQGNPATLIHGIADLPGAVEISPGSKIYRGGIEAAVNGVLDGKYSPLEFRFFVGCHSYEESSLEVAVHLGKYQPVACARAVALKQCISLPKPLWHEGGSLITDGLPRFLSRLILTLAFIY